MPDANDTGTGPRIADAFVATETVGGNILFLKITASNTASAGAFALVGTGAVPTANRLKAINAISVKGSPLLVGEAYSVSTNDILAFGVAATSGWTAAALVTALGLVGITATVDMREYLF